LEKVSEELDRLRREGSAYGLTTVRVNLRGGPGLDQPILALLPENSEVELLSRGGEWTRVRWGSLDGWLSAKYLRAKDDEIASLRQSLSSLRGALTESTTERELLQERAAELASEGRRLEDELESSQVRLREMRANLDVTSAKSSDEISALQDRFSEVERALAESEERERQARSEIASLLVALDRVTGEGEDPHESGEHGHEVAAGMTPGDRADESILVPQDAARRLEERLRAWAAAWSAQDSQKYLAFYAQDFEPTGAESLAAWRERRKRRLAAPQWIRIEVDDLQVQFEGSQRAVSTFEQRYSSDRYGDLVRKRLDWVLQEGEWRISREISD
jgi:hypothetical protein